MATAPPDWVTTRILLAALDLESITRAADRCGVSVSAAANRIQLLETDCGLARRCCMDRGFVP